MSTKGSEHVAISLCAKQSSDKTEVLKTSVWHRQQIKDVSVGDCFFHLCIVTELMRYLVFTFFLVAQVYCLSLTESVLRHQTDFVSD